MGIPNFTGKFDFSDWLDQGVLNSDRDLDRFALSLSPTNMSQAVEDGLLVSPYSQDTSKSDMLDFLEERVAEVSVAGENIGTFDLERNDGRIRFLDSEGVSRLEELKQQYEEHWSGIDTFEKFFRESPVDSIQVDIQEDKPVHALPIENPEEVENASLNSRKALIGVLASIILWWLIK